MAGFMSDIGLRDLKFNEFKDDNQAVRTIHDHIQTTIHLGGRITCIAG